MKKVLVFLVLAAAIFSCSNERDDYFKWLEGTWKVKYDITSDSTSVFHERWWWNENTRMMNGKGFEVLRNDTAWFETLTIEKIKNQWYYRAYVPTEHGDDTINFLLLTKPDSDSLVFQNEENDFPGTIRYIRSSSDKLKIMLESSKYVEPKGEYILELEKVKL